MNSDINSDSEQCTESKLGRVQSAHTHGPGLCRCARGPGALCSVAVCTSVVSWPCPAVSLCALIVSQAMSLAHAAVSWAPFDHDTKTIS